MGRNPPHRPAPLTLSEWILAQVQVCHFALEEDGRVREVSAGSGRVLGYDPDVLVGRNLLHGLHPDDRPRARAALAAALRGAPGANLDSRFLRRDGSLVRLIWRVEWSPAARLFFGTARELGQRRPGDPHLATALNELREFKRALDAHAIVAVTDLRGRITYANDPFCALSKYTRDELLGQDHRLINSGYHPKSFFADMWDTIQAGFIWKGEILNRAKDGTFYWVDTTIVPLLDALGEPAQYVAFRTDITRRKLDEEALRQARKMEELGVLAGGLAHDFNNLLTSILGNSSLAALGLPEDSPAQAHLQQIEKASARAADLTRQMLACAGKGRTQVGPVDINWLVREMWPQLEDPPQDRAELRLDLTPDLPEIQGDAGQIRQMVLSLVTNAREALDPALGGSVTLRTGVCRLTRQAARAMDPATPLKPGRYITVDVVDTGCGMAPEVLGRIFDPFFSTKFMGRGLGLPALLGALRGHGGGIQVASEPGRGSTFRMFLPVPGM